jgi:signal transduction histidine kinase
MSAVMTRSLRVDLAAWPGIVVGVSPSGTVVSSNGRMEDLIGRDVVGRSILELLDRESSHAKWERIAAGAASVNGWEIIFRGGTRLLEPRTFTPLVVDGTVWLVELPRAGNLDALTERMEELNSELATTQRTLIQEQHRLASALRELERSNAALDEFAHAASHDLKSPLRSITDYVELLEAEVGPTLGDEPREYLTRVGVLSARMRGMIDAVLTYARAGRTASAVTVADAGEVLRDVVDFVAPPDDVVIEIGANMPRIEMMRVPFEQVFRNLISNAVKYRRETDARVTITATADGECWRFVVADNGPGIPASQQERMWGLFQTTRPKDGTGIGLALVKRIVESQGGRAFVDSEEGQGARFTVLWPKRAPVARGRQ